MLKKLIAGLVIVALSTSAMARNVTVTFADGSTHRYENTPESVTPEQIVERAQRDFPTFQVVHLDGGRPVEPESEWTAGKVLMTIFGVVLIGAAIYYGIDMIKHAGAAKTHPCVNPSDIAKDGSRCGARASSVRPGGA
jgi:hypothetical protein